MFYKSGETISIIGMSMLAATLLSGLISDGYTALAMAEEGLTYELEKLGEKYIIFGNLFLSVGIILVMVFAVDLLHKQKLTKFFWIAFICFGIAALMRLVWTIGIMDQFEEFYNNYTIYYGGFSDYEYDVVKRSIIWNLLSEYMLIAGMMVSLYWWKVKNQKAGYTVPEETREYFERLDPSMRSQEKNTDQHFEEKRIGNISNIGGELRELKQLKDDGVISEEEYETIKRGILKT